jgi:hypothetical protein
MEEKVPKRVKPDRKRGPYVHSAYARYEPIPGPVCRSGGEKICPGYLLDRDCLHHH